MNHQVTDSQVTNFFKWLENNIALIPTHEKVQHELTKQLKLVHPELRWEIGPGYKENNFLAFSPNLKYELLELTNALVKNAQAIEGWEFLPAKPKKRWVKRNLKISTNGRVTQVHFDNWNYYLTSFNNGEFFDVNLIPDDIGALSHEDLNYAADLFVEFELGEELYIEAIDRVNLVSPYNLDAETNKVQDLNRHILSEWKKIH